MFWKIRRHEITPIIPWSPPKNSNINTHLQTQFQSDLMSSGHRLGLSWRPPKGSQNPTELPYCFASFWTWYQCQYACKDTTLYIKKCLITYVWDYKWKQTLSKIFSREAKLSLMTSILIKKLSFSAPFRLTVIFKSQQTGCCCVQNHLVLMYILLVIQMQCHTLQHNFLNHFLLLSNYQ